MSYTLLSIPPVKNKKKGEKIRLPVSIKTDSPSSISAIDLTIKFDINQLELLAKEVSAGDLTKSWGKPVSNVEKGTLKTSQVSLLPLKSGTGEVLALKFRIIDKITDTILVEIDEKQSRIQEGKVLFTTADNVINLVPEASKNPNPSQEINSALSSPTTAEPSSEPRDNSRPQGIETDPKPNKSSNIKPDQVDDIALETFPNITSQQDANPLSQTIKSINKNQFKQFDLDAIAGIEPNQVDHLKPTIFKVISAAQLTEFSIDAIRAFSPAQLKRIKPEAIGGLSKDQLGAFGATQVTALPKKLIKALQTDQLSALSTDAITGLRRKQLKAFPVDALTNFEEDQIASIPPRSIPGIKPKALDAMGKTQIQALTEKQLLFLSKRQIKKSPSLLDELNQYQRFILSTKNDNLTKRLKETLGDVELFSDSDNTTQLLQ